MSESRPPQIKASHLQRLAIIYIRQSTLPQVLEHQGSTAHQRAQREHARRFGWPDSAIVVIEDLGVSGTTADRAGFQRLLTLVETREAGAIFAVDPSRLSRSTRDGEFLIALCRRTDTLLVIEGVIADLNNPADRLLMRMRGNFAEYWVDQQTATFMAAKRILARKGHAVSLRPTGYIVVEKGKWVKDPDMAVRQAIEEVFRLYKALGTVGKGLQFFHDHGLLLPFRHSRGELRWVRPSRARIYDVLINPAFAGYYVYGRRPQSPGAYPERDVRRRTSWEDWIVVPNHHEAYIPPEEWHAIYERLKHNRITVRQPVGTGPALAQGLLRCGRCGRRMTTQSYPIPSGGRGLTYSCFQAKIQYGEPKCWSVNGRTLDALVAAELLRCLDPPEVEAVLEAAGEVNQGYQAARRQRQVELDDARYEVTRLKKHLRLIDVENRRLAVSLEQDLGQALEKLDQLERHQKDHPLTPPLEVTPEVLEAIRRLAQDVPALWAAPSTRNEDRKALVRLFVQEIRVLSVAKTGCEVEISWTGGGVTRHSVIHPWAGGAVARELAAQGWDPARIAEELNKRGFRTFERKQPYTAFGVHCLLRGAARRARLAAEKRAATAAAAGPAGDGGRDGGGNGTGEGGARGGEGITGGIGRA